MEYKNAWVRENSVNTSSISASIEVGNLIRQHCNNLTKDVHTQQDQQSGMQWSGNTAIRNKGCYSKSIWMVPATLLSWNCNPWCGFNWSDDRSWVHEGSPFQGGDEPSLQRNVGFD